jgi:hypothetical protein
MPIGGRRYEAGRARSVSHHHTPAHARSARSASCMPGRDTTRLTRSCVPASNSTTRLGVFKPCNSTLYQSSATAFAAVDFDNPWTRTLVIVSSDCQQCRASDSGHQLLKSVTFVKVTEPRNAAHVLAAPRWDEELWSGLLAPHMKTLGTPRSFYSTEQ